MSHLVSKAATKLLESVRIGDPHCNDWFEDLLIVSQSSRFAIDEAIWQVTSVILEMVDKERKSP